MSLPFDATLKEMLVPRPEDFAPVFGFPQIEPARRINIDLSTISAATDVAFGFGSPLQEIVDLNFQSGPDRRWRRGCTFTTLLFILIPCPDSIAFDSAASQGKHRRPSRRLAYISGGKRVEFEYDVVRMWQQPVEPFLHGGLGLLPWPPSARCPKIKRWLRPCARWCGKSTAVWPRKPATLRPFV